MNQPFTFYRALDPVKGSWDGYGFFPSGDSDFLVFITDAPSAASVHTPELVQEFWKEYSLVNSDAAVDLARIELADGINRLHASLRKRSRTDGSAYQGTLCIARRIGDQLLYCSIGDSVLQLLRGGKLYRLNDSEIWDGSLVIRENSKLNDRQRTRSLRFVGDGEDFLDASGVATIRIQPGDKLLMNTDGMEDLLSPDRLISLLNLTPDDLRKQLENIFAQERIKDDVTFLMLPMDAPPQFQAEEEIALVRNEVDLLQKEQSRLRGIEETLQRITRDIQSIHQKLETSGSRGSSGVYLSQNKMAARRPWVLAAATFVFGLLVASGLFLLGNPPAPGRSTTTPVPKARSVPPPEIPAPQNCDYVVSKGDTLESIAAAQKMTVETLLRFNPGLHKTTSLKIGQKILLCEGAP